MIKRTHVEIHGKKCPIPHVPNAETARAIEEARQGKNIRRFKTVDDTYKAMGI